MDVLGELSPAEVAKFTVPIDDTVGNNILYGAVIEDNVQPWSDR